MPYVTPIDISKVNNGELEQCLPINLFAIDIGGSLAKLVYKRVFRFRRSIPRQSGSAEDESGLPFGFYDYTEQEYEGQKLCFLKFETRHIDDCLDFVVKEILNNTPTLKKHLLKAKLTGGGAHRFRDLFSLKLRIELEKEDEMECLVRGCTFMLQNIPDELFYYDKHSTPAHVFVSSLTNMFPFLLVNVGSGVSILKIESPTSYERVGGSSIGGGTFWGLGTLLSDGKYSFDDLLKMADSGDHREVDMLVRDIYGGAYEMLRLPGDVIASSFGLAARHPQRPRELADIVKSLLITVSNNIGQLACLYAKEYNLTRILFGGFFIRGHGLTMEVITYAVKFWSNQQFRPLFLRHEGYLGAVGAFLKTANIQDDAASKTLWAENYVTNSNADLLQPSNVQLPTIEIDNDLSNNLSKHVSLASGEDVDLSTSKKVNVTSSTLNDIWNSKMDRFELDRVFSHSLELFPLVDSANYTPDTWDLTQDKEARAYWLDYFEAGVECHRIMAEESQKDSLPDARKRSNQYAQSYTAFLNELKIDPSRRGPLSVRCLLAAQQNFLREFGFGDAFCLQKKTENHAALAVLPSRLQELSQMSWKDRQLALVMGMLAGNVFDWGATESVQFMQQATLNPFGVPNFSSALDKVQKRPWLVDDFDRWMERLGGSQGLPYQCLLLFCDNSGADIILGIFPFVLEFLKRGSKVILAANSSPAINDVTYQELELLVRMASRIEPFFGEALNNKQLMLVENGQTSPCLDFRLIASSLVQLTKSEKAAKIVSCFKTAPERVRVIKALEKRLCRMTCQDGQIILLSIPFTNLDRLFALNCIKRTLVDQHTQQGQEFILNAFDTECDKIKALQILHTVSNFVQTEIASGGHQLYGACGELFNQSFPVCEHTYGSIEQQIALKNHELKPSIPFTTQMNLPDSIFHAAPSHLYNGDANKSYYLGGGKPAPPTNTQTEINMQTYNEEKQVVLA